MWCAWGAWARCGVRQLAGRLMRAVPPSVPDAEAFCVAIHEALSEAAPAAGLRFDNGAIPADAEGTHLLAHVDAIPTGDELIVDDSVAAQLDEIVSERERRAELARVGVAVSRTVLFWGPPGVGKTLAARWIAQRSNCPW